jgi:hypothetical protein
MCDAEKMCVSLQLWFEESTGIQLQHEHEWRCRVYITECYDMDRFSREHLFCSAGIIVGHAVA